MNMIKLAAFAAAVSVMLSGAALAQDAVSPEDCTALMTKADKNADGNLAMDEAAPFAKALSDSEAKPAAEGLMTSAEFMGFCQQGLFKNVQVE